jgi:hypothetical protein
MIPPLAPAGAALSASSLMKKSVGFELFERKEGLACVANQPFGARWFPEPNLRRAPGQKPFSANC